MLANNQLVGIDGVQYNSQSLPGQEIVQCLTDDYGRTLYAFAEKDSVLINKFTTSNFSNNGILPIYTSQLKSFPSSLNLSLFDSTNVYEKMQLTFNGWPLYHFGQDNQQRGSTKGVSFPKPGGIWKVVNLNSPNAP
ncbi:MAG: COG4315 family predicted lipoprotein [Chitinophagaceae bacterium]